MLRGPENRGGDRKKPREKKMRHGTVLTNTSKKFVGGKEKGGFAKVCHATGKRRSRKGKGGKSHSNWQNGYRSRGKGGKGTSLEIEAATLQGKAKKRTNNSEDRYQTAMVGLIRKKKQERRKGKKLASKTLYNKVEAQQAATARKGKSSLGKHLGKKM